MQNTFTKLAKEIATAFIPLSEALSTVDAFSGFMLDLGWNIFEIPDPINNLKTPLQTLIDILEVEEIDINNVDDLISALSEFNLAIDELTSKPSALFPPILIDDGFLTEFPSQLVHYLLIDYLNENHSGFGNILSLFGLVRIEYVEPEGHRPGYHQRQIVWDEFGLILNDPRRVLESAYGWGTSTLNYQIIFEHLIDFADNIGLSVRLEELDDKSLSVFSKEAINPLDVVPWSIKMPLIDSDGSQLLESGLSMFILPETENLKPGFSILPYSTGNFTNAIPISENLTLEMDAGFDITSGLGILFRPETKVELLSNIIPSADSGIAPSSEAYFNFKIENNNQNSRPLTLIGSNQGSRLVAKKLSLTAGVNTDLNDLKDFFVELNVLQGELIILPGEGDSFLRNILPEGGMTAAFDLGLGISIERGFYFRGSVGLDIKLPVHISLGPLNLKSITLEIKAIDNSIAVNLGLSVKTKLGPLVVVVDNVGLTADFTFPGTNGNLGPIDLEMSFKPPNLVGISIDTPAVKGGGFLGIDVEKGEYTGGIELTIQNTISIKAIGIITTKLPNGEEGYSLLLLITAEFNPLQLGFGFTLNGVGGLIGIHRGMNLSAIRVGVQTKALDHILFPDDPVANAPQIIANLNSIFPIAEDNYAFGLMFLIGWGVPTLLEVELGLMISFPSIDIAVIGKLSTALPDKKKPVLVLNVAFAGTLSFENKYFYFDARIENTSRLLSFTLSGDMAVRMLWGDQPNFVLSVGGFHPDFEIPKGLGLENMERITLSLLADDNPRLILKCYFAITSNTAQFGATIDFYFKKSKFKVIGFFYFHALFQFSPFYFIVSIGATLDVKLGSRSILSVGVEGNLEGPTPWKVKGKGRFKIWWVKYSVSFSKTWGEQIDTSLPDIAVYPELKKALLDDRNWAALLPENSTLTTLRDIKDDIDAETEEQDALIIHPFGSMSLAQRVVPLDITIDKYGGQKPSDYKKFSVSFEIDGNNIDGNKIDTNPIRDFFAPAQFFEMSDDQKISKSSYEKYTAGLSDDSETLHSNFKREKAVFYEFKSIDSIEESSTAKGIVLEPASHMAHSAKGTAIAKSQLGRASNLKKLVSGKQIKYTEEEFVVVHQEDLSLLPEVGIGSEFEIQGMLDELLADKPEMEDRLMVVPAYEIV